VRPELFIDPSSKEVLNVLDPQISNLLETRIANLSITNPAIGGAAIQEILSTQEVQDRLATLMMEEAPRQLGFSALSKPGTARPPVTALRMSDVTVRQALDAIAAAMKRGIWTYEEWGRYANGRRSFALSFAVQ
jgi:hypothetical protein